MIVLYIYLIIGAIVGVTTAFTKVVEVAPTIKLQAFFVFLVIWPMYIYAIVTGWSK
jgi:hypothetical protein